MSRPTKPSTVLERAATLLEEEGWAKGAMMCATGKHCASGAIAAITGDLKAFDMDAHLKYRIASSPKDEVIEIADLKPEPSPAYTESAAYLARCIDPAWGTRYYEGEPDVDWAMTDPSRSTDLIVDYNDTKARQRKQVVSTLRKAAKLALAEHR